MRLINVEGSWFSHPIAPSEFHPKASAGTPEDCHSRVVVVHSWSRLSVGSNIVRLKEMKKVNKLSREGSGKDHERT